MSHVCWSHRCSGGPGWTQSSKLHATSFAVFGALTWGLQSHRAVSCVFHPKIVPFIDPKMIRLKGKPHQNCFLRQNWDIPWDTLIKYRSWCCFQTSASRHSKLRLLHSVDPYEHDVPFSGVCKVTKLPQQASVTILWLQMGTVCLYTTQFLRQWNCWIMKLWLELFANVTHSEPSAPDMGMFEHSDSE